jgi:hypothetical protein
VIVFTDETVVGDGRSNRPKNLRENIISIKNNMKTKNIISFWAASRASNLAIAQYDTKN